MYDSLEGRNGRSARVDVGAVARPLGFAPDDRALWVRDAASLVLELAMPDELLAP